MKQFRIVETEYDFDKNTFAGFKKQFEIHIYCFREINRL